MTAFSILCPPARLKIIPDMPSGGMRRKIVGGDLDDEIAACGLPQYPWRYDLPREVGLRAKQRVRRGLLLYKDIWREYPLNCASAP